jgi:hypothetical protein
MNWRKTNPGPSFGQTLNPLHLLAPPMMLRLMSEVVHVLKAIEHGGSQAAGKLIRWSMPSYAASLPRGRPTM